MSEERYTLQENLYKTKDGEIVRAGTGQADSLYKPTGAKIPAQLAADLGLDVAAQAETAGGEEGSEDLDALTREELDAKATELGIEDPDKLKKKADVITAIEAAQEALAAQAETAGGEEGSE